MRIYGEFVDVSGTFETKISFLPLFSRRKAFDGPLGVMDLGDDGHDGGSDECGDTVADAVGDGAAGRCARSGGSAGGSSGRRGAGKRNDVSPRETFLWLLL